MPVEKRRLALLCALCLLLAAAREPLGAVLSGGLSKITAVSPTSGGTRAVNGAIAVNAINIGGPADSGTRMTGGSMVLTTGGTPAVVTFSTARDNLSGAHCYPVPFKPSAGHTKITFTDLTTSARIRIYTISGELVRSLNKANAKKDLEWDVRNSRGSPVDSGVYIYLIEGVGKPKKGKLMIIR
jgi:hypothetical protein